MTELESRRLALERQLSDAKAAAARAEETASETQKRLRALEKERLQTLEEAKETARALVEKARGEAETLLSEMQTLRRKKEKVTDADSSALRAHLKRMEKELDPVVERQQDGYHLPRPLKAGDAVVLADIDKPATVLKIIGDTAEVQIGVIRTRTPVKNLRLQEKKAPPTPKKAKSGGTLTARMERSAGTELDLRGMTVEEAILEIDRFLDNAVMAGLERVTLIHGKGTGALRTGVQQHLRRHPQVAGFRLGTFGEGETGVTVVELK